MTNVDESSTAPGDGAVTNQESQSSNVAAFREAIERCDVQSLDSILAVDKTLWDTPFEFPLGEKNVETVLQIPPLALMTAKKNSSIVQLLLKHGAPVNTEIQTIGGTALHMAARMSAFDAAKMLIDNMASVDQKDSSGSTPLHLASLHASVQFVDLLLDHDADPKLTDSEGCTPFHRAAGGGRLQILESLWARGPKTQIFDRNMYSNQPLHVAAISNRDAVIPWLMSIGAAVLEPGQSGLNAFHHACAEGSVVAAEAILNNSKDHVVHVPNNHKLTPLLLACNSSKPVIVELLWKRGASILDTDNERNTCYHHVILSANNVSPTQLRILDMLHGAGADVNQCNRAGYSPLVFACRLRKTGFIQPLLNLGADINQKGATTVLMEASIFKSSDAIKILLKANPDLNLKNRHGLTALALTCRYGRVENLRELIGANADVTARTKENITPLHLAADCGHVKAVLELLKSNTYYNPKQPLITKAPAETPAHTKVIEKALLGGFDTEKEVMLNDIAYIMFWAVCTGSKDLIERCVEHRVGVLKFESENVNWLHVAAKHGHSGIIRRLAPYFDVSQLTKTGETALHLTVAGGFLLPTIILLKNVGEEDQLAKVFAILKPDMSGESPLSLCLKGSSVDHKVIAEGFWNLLGNLETKYVQLLSLNRDRGSKILETLARYEKPGREKVLESFLRRWNRDIERPSPLPQTALEWAVFHGQAVVVWWLLSKGGYTASHARAKAMKIADQSGLGPRSLVKELLESPPPILEHVDNPSNDIPPALPDPSECDPSDLCVNVDIVDICNQGKELKALYGRGSIKEIIYEESGGPNALMRGNATSLGLRDLAALKARVEETQRSQVGGIKNGDQDQIKETSTANGGRDDSQNLESLMIRWIHLPVNKLHLMRDLVTRLSYDSKRSETDHNVLVGTLNGTWTELPAGGGHFYMKPQCKRVTARDSGQAKDSPCNKPVVRTTPATIYIPYLTMGQKPKNASSGQPTNNPGRIAESIYDRSWKKITHTPITIDQYYYPVLDDTTLRDYDQVLSRYLNLQRRLKGDEACDDDRILMIGHLWMWIIDEKTIVTATAETDAIINTRANQVGLSAGFFQTVLSSMSNGQDGTQFSMPTNMDSMIELMLGAATSFFMVGCVSVGDSVMTPIDVFRQSVKNVVNTETELFQRFIADLKQGDSDADQPETWLKRLLSVYQIPAKPERAITSEAKLLQEMRDIRDELCMLKALAEHQEVVWKQAFETEELRGCFNYYHPYTPSDIKQDLEDMVVEADIETDSINTLLDLRAKQSSIEDAEYSRIQANDEAIQSKSVFIFTIVTVIFLPLSFLSSLFALDISSFPHESGDVKYKAGWIFPILFGSTAIVCIPILIFVWNMNSFSRQPRRINKTNTVSHPEGIRRKAATLSSFRRRLAERSTGDSEIV